MLSVIATILTAFGLSSRDPNRKYTFYRFALYINLAACKYSTAIATMFYITLKMNLFVIIFKMLASMSN